MKKFLMIAVAAMAVASQAANVAWRLSPTTADGFAAGQKVLMFIAGANDTFSYGGTDDLSLDDYVTALLADGADTAEGKAFDTATTVDKRGKISTDEKSTALPSTYAAGDDIVGMMVVLDGNGKYNAFSLSGKVAGSGDTQLSSGMSTATNTTQGFANLPGGGQTIPEPATGALALAGVALLFKRRRA